MLLIALTTVEKLERVPIEFWLKIVMIIAIFVLSIVLIRSISQMNKLLLTFTIFLVVTLVGFHWVYERNEPKFFTPFVEAVAPFFPSKGKAGGW